MFSKVKPIVICITAIIAVCGFALSVQAQTDDKLTLTIAPPLVKLNMAPGDTITSTIKVINNNSVAVNIYTQVMDFTSNEDGGVEFIQPSKTAGDSARFLLSQWLDINTEPVEIPAQGSIDISYAIIVPADAEAGGHYAAILAGTKPIERLSGTGIMISTLLASLIMLDIKGDMDEQGEIREFSLSNTIYTEPKVDFTVRFANTGNIHLQPQGEIRIYDMFGNDKGSITINHATEYGNVLPDSIRKWNFSWNTDKSLSGMGRYKAVLVLGYGSEARETVDEIRYFWLIYPKPVIIILGSIIGLIMILILSLRFYISRAIRRTKMEAGLVAPLNRDNKVKISIIPDDQNEGEFKTVITNAAAVLPAAPPKMRFSRIKKYFIAMIATVVLILVSLVAIYYWQNRLESGLIEADDQAGQVSGEPSQEIQSTAADTNSINDMASTTAPVAERIGNAASSTNNGEPALAIPSSTIKNKAEIAILVLNGSGRSGIAAMIKLKLSSLGYINVDSGNANNFNYQNALIKYRPEYKTNATEVAAIFGAAVDLEESGTIAEDMDIIVGSNYKAD